MGQRQSLLDSLNTADSTTNSDTTVSPTTDGRRRRLDLGSTGTDFDSTSISQSAGDVIMFVIILFASIPIMVVVLLILRLW